jgi:Concanavalin A-like lectin/glucanases superfamily
VHQPSFPSALRGRVVPVLAVVLAVSMLPVAAAVTSSSPADRAVAPIIREAPDVASAARAASVQDIPVRVTDLTTATRVVDARPDGTMTATVHARPQRVRKDGRWIGIDTTLVQRPDGTVGPRAVEVALAFSGGGAKTPMVRQGEPGRSIALSWPGRLPVPALSGATATYPEVLPGVDLVLRAEVDGYAQHLVVKSAQAVKNPALRRIRLGLSAKGLKVTADRAGALRARDAKGAVAFSAPPSAMWDSGSASARVGIALDGASLVLTPDPKVLDDPRTRFPVVVDPTWAYPARNGWTKVFSGKSGQSYWNGANDVDTWAKVGLCQWSDCQGIGVARSYFQFDTVFLAGKDIISAAVNTRIVYGPSCNVRNHDIYAAWDIIKPETTWDSKPAGGFIERKAVGSNYSGCAGDQRVGFNVTGAVARGAYSAYYIQAADENDKFAWRKYDGFATSMEVNYNTAPSKATGLYTRPLEGDPCRWCAGKHYLSAQTVQLNATLTDADGEALFAKWRVSAGGVITQWDGALGPPGEHRANIGLQDKHGKEINWWVHGDDGRTFSEIAYTPKPFTVDLVRPGVPPHVTGGLYQNDNRWHGGAGVPGEFRFAARDPGRTGTPAADGVDDIDHYVWGFQDPPTTKVLASALGGGATAVITPPGDGPRTLYVRSVDRAGNESDSQLYRFYVRAGNGPVAQWSLDGNAEDTAFLGDRDGTLTGTGSYEFSAVGLGLRVAGAGYVTTPSTVRTDSSFSVTAWAKIDSVGTQWRPVISQRSTATCAFCLQYEGDGKGWVFVLPRNNSANPAGGWSVVRSPEPPSAGEWTHLAGTYDADAKQIKLYVDGKLAGSAPHPTAWHEDGPMHIGNGFSGGIDEVKVYDRSLSAGEIAAEVSRDNVQLGHWKFDECQANAEKCAGKTVENAVSDGPSGVLQGGAKFDPEGAVGWAAKFGAAGDQVGTGTAVVRTDRSFSVGGFLRLDAVPATAGGAATAISQDGTHNSGFLLGYRHSDQGRWEFQLPSADAASRPADSVVLSAPNTVRVGQWTHVMGVYDAATKRIEIFVDGKSAGTAVRGPGFHATGELVFGRGRLQGAAAQHWNGGVDEVRAYSRALSAAEIQGLVAQSGVSAGKWLLDGDVRDSSGSGLNGTEATSGVTWTGGHNTTPDPSDLAITLDGAKGHAHAAHAVNTSQSFSVAAMVRLAKVGPNYGVVSQDGRTVSAFKLEAAGGTWAFSMVGRDENGGAGLHRAGGGTVQADTWTHLVGVYDAGAKQLSLYVNGALAGTGTHTGTAWDYDGGRLQIGRSKWNGLEADFLAGAIDDVTVYNRTLFADEIRTLAGRDLALVHNWRLDEQAGATTVDALSGRRGTLSGTAAFGPGRVGNGVQFAGGKGAVSTGGVDVRTDDSFTVSAWVNLSTKDCDLGAVAACRADAVTVDGATGSKFRLGHVIDDTKNLAGSWTFEAPESDSVNAEVKSAAVTTFPSEVNRWVHLAGVYHKPSKKIWLYVDGSRMGDGTLDTAWQASGGLQIGRGLVAGQPDEHWSGEVDDVRMYKGVLDKDRIAALYDSYPAERAPATLPPADLGHWRLDEGTGTAVADASGNGRTATLKGGTGWTGGRDGHAAWLDGTSGFAETAGPVLDTTAAFSMSAWVYLSGDSTDSRTVIGQDGKRVSVFQLQYHGPAKKWAVVAPSNDADDTPSFVMTSTEPAAVGEWTHVAMTYEPRLGHVRLYVNGALTSARSGVAVRESAGPMSIGRSKWNGRNLAFFPRGVDDVRAYSKALTDGEVRKVHDDMPASATDAWKFDDGTGRDYAWQRNDVTLTGGVAYPTGLSGSGKAIHLDGVSGAGVSKSSAVSARDSFTISAWAKLTRTDKQATVVGQDGSRNSSFTLQYRPILQRWVFAAPKQDADGAEVVFAESARAPVVNQWSHLTGVYDLPARQLRLYVDGKLVGSRDDVTLWRATGGLTIGRGRSNGAPADFFPGEIDEVTAAVGAAPAADIARQGGWPAPITGQFGRFLNTAGDHYTGATGVPARDGYRYEGTLGSTVPADHPNTRKLYACVDDADAFTSTAADCEDGDVLGEIGLVYASQPVNVPTVPIYRCAWSHDDFDSRREDCEGATKKGLLGYSLAYAHLARYYHNSGPVDHLSTVEGTPPGYRLEGSAGIVPLAGQPGTVPLMSCRADTDHFVSTDASCEGATVVSAIGQVWSAAPEGMASQPIYRCAAANQRFVSITANCEGATVDRRIGYALLKVPDVTPTFG